MEYFDSDGQLCGRHLLLQMDSNAPRRQDKNYAGRASVWNSMTSFETPLSSNTF